MIKTARYQGFFYDYGFFFFDFFKSEPKTRVAAGVEMRRGKGEREARRKGKNRAES